MEGKVRHLVVFVEVVAALVSEERSSSGLRAQPSRATEPSARCRRARDLLRSLAAIRRWIPPCVSWLPRAASTARPVAGVGTATRRWGFFGRRGGRVRGGIQWTELRSPALQCPIVAPRRPRGAFPGLSFYVRAARGRAVVEKKELRTRTVRFWKNSFYSLRSIQYGRLPVNNRACGPPERGAARQSPRTA